MEDIFDIIEDDTDKERTEAQTRLYCLMLNLYRAPKDINLRAYVDTYKGRKTISERYIEAFRLKQNKGLKLYYAYNIENCKDLTFEKFEIDFADFFNKI